MGRKNKKYKKNLKQQVYDKLTEMLHKGEGKSKKQAVAEGTADSMIFSYCTYKSYFKHCKYFINYLQERHPDVTTLKSAKKYVREWLQCRIDNGGLNGQQLSAWTISLEREALNKLFNIKPDDPDFVEVPKRRRVDIKRSRGEVERDKHFSEKNNWEFIQFCKGTGCRSNVIKKLEGRDLHTIEEIQTEISRIEKKDRTDLSDQKHLEILKDALRQFPEQKFFVHHRNDKGGRDRYAPIVGDDTDRIVERFRKTKPYEKVWKHVPSRADIHGYRAVYATDIYNMYARPINDIPKNGYNQGSGRFYQKDVYVCRCDERGKKLDRIAMLKASKALGHNRVDVIARHYLRGI